MELELLICIIAISAMGYGTWRVVRWFFKLGANHAKKNDLLRPSDLGVLEDTTKRLMDDLKALTDDCVSRIEQACRESENRIASAQSRGAHSDKLIIGSPDPIPVAPYGHLEQLVDIRESTIQEMPTAVARGGQTVTSFARSTGLTMGEVELMRGLREYGKSKKDE